MFGLGISEIIVIVVAALIFVGPKQLPEFIKSAGKLFVQIRRAANEVKSTVDGVIREAEEEVRKEAKSISDSVDQKAISKSLSDIPAAFNIPGSLDVSMNGVRANFATGGLELPDVPENTGNKPK
ncbi:MAG: twin-arginine translocase subunit TatB [Proteobacteria bacterium]|nr:twin-arginine translocase subunit TatB [Pseudomonadota bacterium]